MTTPNDQADDPPLSNDEWMQLATLRTALALGEASGPSRPFNFVALLACKAPPLAP